MNIDSRALARAPLAGRLGGRTAIITGGANGMGLAAVRMFAEAGAKVAILDIAAGAGRAAEAELTSHGHNVMFIETDVTRSDAVRAALAQVYAAWGPVDTLFSHAGMMSGSGCVACQYTGYRGRIGLFDILPITPKLRHLISAGASEVELRRQARAQGWRPLFYQGLRSAEQGVTTLDEILRVVGIPSEEAAEPM